MPPVEFSALGKECSGTHRQRNRPNQPLEGAISARITLLPPFHVKQSHAPSR